MDMHGSGCMVLQVQCSCAEKLLVRWRIAEAVRAELDCGSILGRYLNIALTEELESS